MKEYLVNDHGVDPDRVEAVGKGQSEPVASNDTPEGRQSNRRVELVQMQADEAASGQDKREFSGSTKGSATSEATPDGLASLLPAEIPDGFRRTDLQSGVRQGEPGAQATYEGNDGSFDITLGTVNAQTRTMLNEMLDRQAAREDALRSMTYRGHSGYQGSMQGRQQILIFVAERVMVRVGTDDDLPVNQLRVALDAIDFFPLEDLATSSSDQK